MKLTPKLLLILASVALASCSAEPSDWRPDEKVSNDLVAPGTRATENFDRSVPNASIEDVNSPLMQAATAEAEAEGKKEAKVPSAESAISANAGQDLRQHGRMNDAGKSNQADPAASGHQIRR